MNRKKVRLIKITTGNQIMYQILVELLISVSSRSEEFCKKGALKIPQNSHKTTYAGF